jgi:hypothetical protein
MKLDTKMPFASLAFICVAQGAHAQSDEVEGPAERRVARTAQQQMGIPGPPMTTTRILSSSKSECA